MYHLLVDLYQDCSYDAPWVKTGPDPGGSQVRNRNEEGKLLNSSLKLERTGRTLIFGMQHLLVDFYQDCSYDAPGVKTGPALGVTSLKHTSMNKEGKL